MRRLLLVAMLAVTAVLTAPNAVAAVPNWSGLDATAYSGPIGANGTLIESVPLDPSIGLPSAAAAYRYLYATTDVHDRPAVSTSAVFVPPGAAPEGGWPIVAWAHGTVGLGDDCTPSALPRSERDVEYLDHWLEQGYAVVASDYVGLGTPGLMSYLDTVSTAHAIVDSVVAAHATDLPLSPKWAVIGQSQGGAGALEPRATQANSARAAVWNTAVRSPPERLRSSRRSSQRPVRTWRCRPTSGRSSTRTRPTSWRRSRMLARTSGWTAC